MAFRNLNPRLMRPQQEIVRSGCLSVKRNGAFHTILPISQKFQSDYTDWLLFYN